MAFYISPMLAREVVFYAGSSCFHLFPKI